MDDVGLRRLTAQRLVGPRETTADDVVRHLLAVQAQDLRAARLAIRPRASPSVTAADVDDALAQRRLVVAWLNRGTLHLVRSEDYWWLHPLTAPQHATTSRRRLQQEGVSPEQAVRGVDVVVRALTEHGPLTRDALKSHLDAARVPTAGQALVHVLFATSLLGLLVRGPVIGNEQAFALTEQWLGPRPPPLDLDEALGRLAGRYLAGHTTADAQDLATWAKIPLGQARRGLQVAGPEPVEVASVRSGGPPAPRLLGGFDPVLHGWASRDWVVGPHRSVVTSNGIFRPTVLVEGRVVGTWRLPSGSVALDLLEDVDPGVRAALDAEALDVRRYLGRTSPP